MESQKNKGLNIPIILACILFSATLFSFHFLGGLYARYTKTSEASDSARVAKFDVSGNFSDEIELTPGENNTEIHLENNGEVAVEYTIVLNNMTNNIPYELQVVGDVEPVNATSVKGYLDAKKDVTLVAKIQWDEEDALKYMGMVDLIKLTVNAQQVD